MCLCPDEMWNIFGFVMISINLSLRPPLSLSHDINDLEVITLNWAGGFFLLFM